MAAMVNKVNCCCRVWLYLCHGMHDRWPKRPGLATRWPGMGPRQPDVRRNRCRGRHTMRHLGADFRNNQPIGLQKIQDIYLYAWMAPLMAWVAGVLDNLRAQEVSLFGCKGLYNGAVG
ncbi:hypothetical protein E3N88_27477 [Mikania micrantha]|uniref:Uncharacterized protein n=1 Tax=Mikania micrantha TaxID=192012 RepID=A0A5N6MXT8_9ASTR|nr:hypothetical protein E3N88_27477 [Mikania micrantha]